MPTLGEDELNKRLRAIENLRMAGVSEDREAQLKAEAQVYRDQLNTINALRTSVGGSAIADTSQVAYGAPEGGYKPTQISAQGQQVEAAKKRYAELNEVDRINRTPEQEKEMASLASFLNQ